MYGAVRVWYSDDGWGVIDSDSTPGGCWAHFSVVEMEGYVALSIGTDVDFEFEEFAQDGFEFRATHVIPMRP
jgi:CspA family cold shock protein